MGLYFNGFSGIDFVWDRIQESRKNQIISYLILITGVTFFSGGFLETITSSGNPTWLLFIPYKLEPLTQNFVSLFILISGFMFSILGLSSCIYYKFDRECYFNLIKEDDTKQNKRFSQHGTKAFLLNN